MKFPSGLRLETFEHPKGFDPLEAEDKDLSKYGIPPRPEKNPELLKKWKEMLQGVHFLKPAFGEPVTGVRHHLSPAAFEGEVENVTETSDNWSGGVAYPTNSTVTTAYGEWTVPYPYPPAVGPAAPPAGYYYSTWVGIDGDGSADVVQAGITAHTTGWPMPFGGPPLVISTNFAWIEWWSPETVDPSKAAPVLIAGFPIAWGDTVSCWVQSTSATGANIVLRNISHNNQAMSFALTAPPQTNLVGNCAEWIVERPSPPPLDHNPQHPYGLANYGSVQFVNCASGLSNNTSMLPGSGNNINMTDLAGNLISAGNLVGADAVKCTYI
ncbi:G1 family glutamic endopeptidase [Streptomyces rishiriensis]|uniref:G1 family glutamic endopeptidase n=1 Tax=Streptomyces rishiriensis TaxID=68264 RepID=UPI0033D5104D